MAKRHVDNHRQQTRRKAGRSIIRESSERGTNMQRKTLLDSLYIEKRALQARIVEIYNEVGQEKNVARRHELLREKSNLLFEKSRINSRIDGIHRRKGNFRVKV